MNQQEQQKHFEKLVDEMRQTLLKKGQDYAGDSDRLFNFKSTGYLLGTTAAASCMTLIATKMARLTTLLQSGRTPNNESIRDTTKDLACYAVILDSIVCEQLEDAKNSKNE